MVEGPATDAAFAIVFLVLGGLIAVGLTVMVRGLLTGYSLLGEAAECTASRDANITASISQPRRRTIVSEPGKPTVVLMSLDKWTAHLAAVDRYGADQWRRGNAGREPQEFEEWRREQ